MPDARRAETVLARALAIATAALTAIALLPAPALAQTHYIRGGERPVATRHVAVGQDIQAIVDNTAPGSTFILASGVHRGQTIVPRDGDTFVGEPGAVLSGAKALDRSAFVREGGVWRIGGQTQQLPTTGVMGCTDWSEGRGHFADCGHEAEVFSGNELFADGRRLRHVNAANLVDAPGEWHFDDAADVIRMYDDPRSFGILETTTTAYAFDGRRTNAVTLRDLTVQMYGSPAQIGAVDARQSTNWTLDGVTIANNHGSGVGASSGMTITHSRILHNGNTGIEGRGDEPVSLPIRVRHNEIAYNSALGYQPGWNAGGVKLALTAGAVVERNWVHHNRSKGIWFDIDNVDALVRENLVEFNDTVGIFYEISRAGRITGNTVFGNHTSGNMIRSFGNVTIASSSDVEIDHNWIGGDGTQELGAYHQDRGPGLFRMRVHDNVMVLNSPWGGGQAGVKDTGAGDPYRGAGNVFERNRYFITPQTHIQPFWWDGRSMRPDEWQAVTGEAVSQQPAPPPGADGVGVARTAVGPSTVGPEAR